MPTIFPSLPPRPTTPNVTATLAYYDTATPPPVTAGQLLYADTLDTMESHGPFFNPSWGSPLIYATHEFARDAVFSNAGTIWAYSTAMSTTAVFTDRFVNTGTVIAETNVPFIGVGYTLYGTARAVMGNGRLDNSGTLLAIGHGGNAITFSTQSVRESFVNSGTIAAQASYGYDPQQSGGAQAFVMTNGGYLTNGESGIIFAEGDALARAVVVMRGEHPAFAGGPSVLNRGLIEAVSTDPAHESVGIYVVNITDMLGRGERMVIENYGTIRADIAIYAPSSPSETFTSSILVAPQIVYNRAGGVIDGDIQLVLGADRLENQGTIIGVVDMGDGRDVVDSTAGVIIGHTDLGFGDDEYIGSNGVDAVLGNLGNDIIRANAGDDLILGGSGDDQLIGGLGNDGLYGEAGDDVIVTAGGDFASGGGGRDRIETSDFSFERIDGGEDWDIWQLPAGARQIDLSQVAASGRVSGFEEIGLGGSNLLVVRAADVAAMTGGGSLVVSASPTDSVYLVGAWAAGAANTINGVAYSSYTNDGATLFVQQGAAVTIGTAPPAEAAGLDAIADGPSAPLPGSIAGVELAGTVTTVVDYILFEDLTIGAGDIWRSSQGIVLSAMDFDVDIVNNGTLVSINDSPAGIGVAFGPSSLYRSFDQPMVYNSFTNNGEVIADAAGAAIAFFSAGLGRLENIGDIHAYAGAGDATAVLSYGSATGSYAVWNRGDIYAQAMSAIATGVRFGNAASLLNEGVIEAAGMNGAIAVDMFNSGTLINSGSILASVPLDSDYLSVGILTGTGPPGSSIDNRGTIAAEVAISIVSGSFGRVDINNSGTIWGDIVLDHLPNQANGRMILTNSAEIIGNVWSSTGADRIENAGSIVGDIRMGDGDDVYSGGGRTIGDIFGEGGNDRLTGGEPGDRLFGGAGDDILQGGGGTDYLDGGDGRDIFVFALASDSIGVALRSDGAKFLPDTIDHFDSGTDVIDLSAIDAVAGGDTNEAFIFIGTGAFTHQAGELRYDMVDGRAYVSGDVNGDGLADFVLAVNTPVLQGGDFVL